jgi:Collagen triple helix repeat (20 copies)
MPKPDDRRGTRGVRGSRGPRGAQGLRGPQGATGATGPTGPAGASTPLVMLSTIVQHIEAIQRDLEVQFQRTAQIQADLDLLRAQLAKQFTQ